MKETEDRNSRIVICSHCLTMVTQSIYEHHSQCHQPCHTYPCVEHDVRWNPEAITSDPIMPLPVPCQTQFCLQQKIEHGPGAYLTQSTLNRVGAVPRMRVFRRVVMNK